MTLIRTFPFHKDKFQQLKEYHFGQNWPVVYIQENGTEMYIGETTNVFSRSKQHWIKSDRRRLKNIHVITDEQFNLSSAKDFESLLIQYISAEGRFKLQNGNDGLINHNYFDRERYISKLQIVWDKLKELGLTSKDLPELRNSSFFKYSPYKGLTEEQLLIADDLEKRIKSGDGKSFIVNGGPGTGKSVMALYLLKHLTEIIDDREFSVALVISMTSLRSTLQKVVRRVPGMKASMVIGPNEVAKRKYDLLIVDESHRLRRRVNLGAAFGPYDNVNKSLGLSEESTNLDWIVAQSKQQIFFYDKRQSVMPGDIRPEDFKSLDAIQYELTSQMRVDGGNDYLQYVDNLLEGKRVGEFVSDKYEFKVYEHIGRMVADIKEKDAEHKLARIVAGYGWPWASNPKKAERADYDMELDGVRLVWNSTTTDWVNSPNSLNEVGCIHTVQGYDLNYAGVIIGPELTYDERSKKLVVDEKKYKDTNGKQSVTHPDELQQYVINIYKTLMSRGIRGTYIYVVDEKLRKHFKTLMGMETEKGELVKSPITLQMVMVPLVGSAPCGNPLLGEENIEEYIEVEKSKLKPGFDYFILRAEGDSMNLAGINDGDLVLCRQQLKADTGDRVVALLGDNVTIKMYDKKDDRRILLPKSTNKSHSPIIPDEGDSVQGVVQEVLD